MTQAVTTHPEAGRESRPSSFPAEIYGAKVEWVQHPLVFAGQNLCIESLESHGSKYPEGVTCGVDLVDPQGEIARVWVFIRNGNLYASGKHNVKGRNPENLHEMIQRPRRIRVLRLAIPREVSP